MQQKFLVQDWFRSVSSMLLVLEAAGSDPGTPGPITVTGELNIIK